MLAYYGPEWESLQSRMVDRWCTSFSGNTGLQFPSTMGRNHGVLTNMDRNTSWVGSGGKLASDFDGSNDEIVVGDHPSLSFTSANSITMIAWVKPSTSTNYRTIFTKRIANNSNYELSFNNSDNKILFYAGGAFAVSTVAAATGEWSQVCCTSGPSGGAYFINGVAAGTHGNPIGAPNSEPLRIGSANNQQRFPGQIDDAIIFNTALTANEVRFLYEQGRGGGLLMQPPRRRSVAAVIAALVLACETANYSLTGQAAGLFASRLLAADQAQYLLSGNAANITASRLLSVDPASYTATGNDAATICARLLDGGAAAYALTGTDAGLIANRKLTAEQAICFLAGNNAELLRSLKLNAGSMALELDSLAASLLANRTISADGAQYILVVSDANLTGSASGVAPYYYLFMMRGPQ